MADNDMKNDYFNTKPAGKGNPLEPVRKASEASHEVDEGLLQIDDLDFGDSDEDLLSALQLKKNKSSHRSIDVSEFFEGQEGEFDNSEPEGTIVLGTTGDITFDPPEEAPETTLLDSGAVPETTILDSGAIPETTILDSGAVPGTAIVETDAEPEAAIVESTEAIPEPADQGDAEGEPEATALYATEDEPETETPKPTENTAGTTVPEPPKSEPRTVEAQPLRTIQPETTSSRETVSSASSPIQPVAPESRVASDADAKLATTNKTPLIAIGVIALVAIIGIVIFVFASSSSHSNENTSAPKQAESASASPASEKAVFTISVEYRDMQTNETLEPARTEEVSTDDMPNVINTDAINGYTAVRGTDNGLVFYDADDYAKGKKAELDLSSKEADSHRIVFLYAKQVNYMVRYLDSGTNAELSGTKTESGKLSGDTVTEQAINIEGYTLASAADATITLTNDEANNVITFLYNQNVAEAPIDTSSQNTYIYEQPTYYEPTPVAPTPAAPTPSAPTVTDDAVDGSWG